LTRPRSPPGDDERADSGPSGAVVLDELRRLGRADQITATSRLSGGTQADVWLITYADGTRVVGKTITDADPDLFAAEANGLAALRGTGHLATPRVLAVTSGLLLLEALVARDDSEPSWEQFARDLAAAHRGSYLSEPTVEQALTGVGPVLRALPGTQPLPRLPSLTTPDGSHQASGSMGGGASVLWC
jgi:hypothetical protein